MANHLFFPLISLLLGASLSAIFGRQRRAARAVVIISILVHFGYSAWLLWWVGVDGRQVTHASDWAAPFGITLVADGMSALMLFVSSLLVLMTLVYSLASLDPLYERYFYYPLLLLLLLGVSGSFLTGDLFNLYVWFEVLLMSSFGLMTLGGSPGQLEGGLKYMVLNLLGSIVFLTGCGMIYGLVGTLNMAHLAERMATIAAPGLLTVIAALFLFAFGSKAAIVPVFFWLPASYHTPPVAVTAIFSGLLTKVGIYSLYRVLGVVMPNELAHLAPLILILAGLTMFIGVVGAMAQMNIRRILSFHIVSQIGYSLMGLGLASAVSFSAGMLFTAHVMIVKTALFFIGGVAERIYGTGELKKMGGLAKHSPTVAIFWFLGILSLAGIPPLSGFFGKLALLQAGLTQGQYLITGLAAGISLLTMFSMLKIWNEVFWKAPVSEGVVLPKPNRLMLLPGAFLVILSLVMGLGAGALSDYTQRAGQQLADQTGYTQAVCGQAGCEAAFTEAMP